MTKEDVQKMIRKALDNTFKGRQAPDCAAKMYFYPLSSALFTAEEREGFLLRDGITFRPGNIQWVEKKRRAGVIEEVGRRLAEIVKEMGLGEMYLSFIVYGGPSDVVYHIDQRGEYSIATFQSYQPKVCCV